LRLFLVLFAFLVLLSGQNARADSCTASMTSISFGDVSPVSGQDYYAGGTLSITCTAVILQGNIIVLPTINTCASLAGGSGTTSGYLVRGGRRIPFSLYRAATYAAPDIWGGYISNTAISSLFGGILAVGTATQTYQVYARISASDLVGASIDSDAGSSYSGTLSGLLNYTSGTLLALPCQNSGATAMFAFNVSARIINDCTINASPVSFGYQGVLTGAARANGSLSVRCTAGSSYRITLNGGAVANAPASRKMKNAVTGETIDYKLSASLDGPVWGDGSSGTSMYTGTGNGVTQQVTVYGIVPQQTSPTPGDYSDKVIATVYF